MSVHTGGSCSPSARKRSVPATKSSPTLLNCADNTTQKESSATTFWTEMFLAQWRDELNNTMNLRIFFWSLTAALAGFLFGFDTVVISGAEKTIQSLWGLSPGLHGFAIASALYGTVFGALLGGWPADRFGRKFTLLWLGLLYILGAVGSALAPTVGTFIAARFIGGLGIGDSTVG